MKGDLALRFRRAAAQRFADAESLFREHGYIGAVYLTGYAVECSLKSLILACTPPKDQATLVKGDFIGSRGHNLEHLKELLKQKNQRMPQEVYEVFRRVNKWSTDLRYEVGLGSVQQASGYLEAAKQIMDLVEKRL